MDKYDFRSIETIEQYEGRLWKRILTIRTVYIGLSKEIEWIRPINDRIKGGIRELEEKVYSGKQYEK